MTVLQDTPPGAHFFEASKTRGAAALTPSPRRFVAAFLMAGTAATSTLAYVSPRDEAALRAPVVESRTLPAFSSGTEAKSPPIRIPDLLRRLRAVAALDWGEIAGALGVTRRTIHNWLNGARVAEIHLAHLQELTALVEQQSLGVPEETRIRLLSRGVSGRSPLSEFQANVGPRRPRPLSSTSLADLIAPNSEAETPRAAARASTMRGRAINPRRRPAP